MKLRPDKTRKKPSSSSSIGSNDETRDLKQDMIQTIELLQRKDTGVCQNHENTLIDFNKLKSNVLNGVYDVCPTQKDLVPKSSSVDSFKIDFRQMCLATLQKNSPFTILARDATRLLITGLKVIMDKLGYAYEQDVRPCKSCQKTNHPTKTLLCDLCNDPYHIYCLSDPLEDIPQGRWYCTDCCILEQNRHLQKSNERAKLKRLRRDNPNCMSSRKRRKRDDYIRHPSEALVEVGPMGNFILHDADGKPIDGPLFAEDDLASDPSESPLFPIHVVEWMIAEKLNPSMIQHNVVKKEEKEKLGEKKQKISMRNVEKEKEREREREREKEREREIESRKEKESPQENKRVTRRQTRNSAAGTAGGKDRLSSGGVTPAANPHTTRSLGKRERAPPKSKDEGNFIERVSGGDEMFKITPIIEKPELVKITMNESLNQKSQQAAAAAAATVAAVIATAAVPVTAIVTSSPPPTTTPPPTRPVTRYQTRSNTKNALRSQHNIKMEKEEQMDETD